MKRRDTFIAAMGLLLMWQIAAIIVNLPILPAPFKVFRVFVHELGHGLLSHFVFSLWRVSAGMALSVLVRGSARAGDRRIQKPGPIRLSADLPVVPNPQSCLCAGGDLVFRNW